MYKKTIACLANSRKPPSGRCIAGKEIGAEGFGAWVRPVSDRLTHEVSEEERRYEDGSKAQLLDIIAIPLKEPASSDFQVENHTLDDDHYWERVGHVDWKSVQKAADAFDAGFWCSAESTWHGVNDKLSEQVARHCKSSLKLIVVPHLQITVHREEGYNAPGRRRVRGSFSYQGSQYKLSVTDPVVEESYLGRGDGDYDIVDAALCISLGEIWNGYAFRLIASVITKDRCR